jgi:predicted RNA-binding Zn-ribbon protein involved in translation (DUF1610 family)
MKNALMTIVETLKVDDFEPVLLPGTNQIRKFECPHCGKLAAIFKTGSILKTRYLYLLACTSCGYREQRPGKNQLQNQCTGTTKNGTRCKKMAINGYTCAMHNISIADY